MGDHLDVLTRLNVRYEEILCALEDDVDVDGEVLVRIRQHQEVQELGVVQEEEAVECQTLLLKIFVGLLL